MGGVAIRQSLDHLAQAAVRGERSTYRKCAEDDCPVSVLGRRDYERVVMQNCDDQGKCAKGKRWFCSAAEAEEAGCRRPKR